MLHSSILSLSLFDITDPFHQSPMLPLFKITLAFFLLIFKMPLSLILTGFGFLFLRHVLTIQSLILSLLLCACAWDLFTHSPRETLLNSPCCLHGWPGSLVVITHDSYIKSPLKVVRSNHAQRLFLSSFFQNTFHARFT